MKYKIIIACIFTMLVLSSTFCSASAIIENTTEDVVISGSDDCIVYIITPELGYMYAQFFENSEPIKGDQGPWPVLEALNLALYFSIDCYQFFVDTFVDCSFAAKARFSTKVWSTGEEIVKWDNDPSNGFSVFFDLPTNYILYKETKVDIYDSDGTWLAGNQIEFNVLLIPIINPNS